jgi:GDPmannose 4,6-dehydratase
VPTSWSQPVLTAEFTAVGVTRLLTRSTPTTPASASTRPRRRRCSAGQELQTELTPFHPRSPYGVAKVYGHHTVNYRESYGLFAVSGSCSTTRARAVLSSSRAR